MQVSFCGGKTIILSEVMLLKKSDMSRFLVNHELRSKKERHTAKINLVHNDTCEKSVDMLQFMCLD